MCLDRMNNLISFFQIFRTYTEVKGLTTQATTSTPPCRQEGCEQPKKEHTMLANPRPHAPRSRGHLPRPLLGLCYVQT
jgi:hypothetical protein